MLKIWLCLLRIGTVARTRSSNVMQPTPSCCRSTRYASEQASVQAYSYLFSGPFPYAIEFEISTSSVQRRFVSSSNCLTYSRSCRAQTFQSTWRRSSPVTYSRCCRNSTDCPKYGLLCIPERKPSTMCRARTSSREIRLIASGCKNLFEPGIARELIFLGGGAGDQAVDDPVRRYAVALRRKIHDQSMSQHRLGQCLDIVRADVCPPAQQCPCLAAQNQKLH